jgi:hypothetical protein
MCSIQAAVAGLNIATSIQEYRSKKALAKTQRAVNERTRENSDKAYLYDIQRIDNERVAANREKVMEEFRQSQESIKKQSQALNLNAGNSDKIIQDIAGTYDMQFLDVARDYETDMVRLLGKEQEAYAAQERRYNSIAPVVEPSRTGLLLNIGVNAAKGYQAHTAATEGALSNTDDINKLSAIRTATEGSS